MRHSGTIGSEQNVLEDYVFAYIQEITEPLTRFLNHASGLRRDLLARHVANVEFWVAEMRHCLGVLDDYPARLRAMRDVARTNLNYHFDETSGNQSSERPTKSITDTEREMLRRELCDAGRRFLNRSYRERLLERDRLEEFFDKLGMQGPGKD
jgi:hypothetical protein